MTSGDNRSRQNPKKLIRMTVRMATRARKSTGRRCLGCRKGDPTILDHPIGRILQLDGLRASWIAEILDADPLDRV